MITRRLWGIWLLAVCVLSPAPASGEGGMTDADRIRIREADRITAELGDAFWPGWPATRRVILLVTADEEYLINHPSPTGDFIRAGDDSLLAGPVYVRSRVFPRNLLASFPAVGGVPSVVIGQPRFTDAGASTRWVMTLIHEFFHLRQQSQDDYYESTAALGLARGDSTGRWMLDYPFPYDSKEVNEVFSYMCRKLYAAVRARYTSRARKLTGEYLEARDRVRQLLSPDDYTYFSFQVWQEGIARYTEYVVAKRAGAVYQPTADYMDLPDYSPFEADAKRTREHAMTELLRLSLKRDRRRAFYHVGAAEGMLLDRISPAWRERYFKDKFFVEKYFESEGLRRSASSQDKPREPR